MLPVLQAEVDGFDGFDGDPSMQALGLTLEESGVCIELKTKGGDVYSYSLEQLKKLKVELEDPIFNSLKEVS